MRTTLLARRLPLTLLLFVGSLQVMAQTNWAVEKTLRSAVKVRGIILPSTRRRIGCLFRGAHTRW